MDCQGQDTKEFRCFFLSDEVKTKAKIETEIETVQCRTKK